MGIEPTSEAWEASILPLYDARPGSNQPQDSTALVRTQEFETPRDYLISG
jgi:hypothetical protein